MMKTLPVLIVQANLTVTSEEAQLGEEVFECCECQGVLLSIGIKERFITTTSWFYNADYARSKFLA